MDKIKNLIKNIIRASNKLGNEEQFNEIKALANELDYTISHYKKPKIYVFKSNFLNSNLVVSDWDTICPILHRDGYKIEIVKIKKPLFSFNTSIYYQFIEE